MNVFGDKKEARRFFLQKRLSLDADTLRQRSGALCENICTLDEFKNADTVLVYAPTKNEPDLLGVAEAAWKLGKHVSFPISNTSDCTLDFRQAHSFEDLQIGAYGIYEPSKDAPNAEITEKTLCVVPALAVDKNGFRLGYGKGYYDRFLKDFAGTSVCAIFDGFVCENILRDDTDISVDVIIFETGVVKIK